MSTLDWSPPGNRPTNRSVPPWCCLSGAPRLARPAAEGAAGGPGGSLLHSLARRTGSRAPTDSDGPRSLGPGAGAGPGWNVDGLRAWIKKKGLDWVKEEAPDILCLQETKCSENKLPAELQELPGLTHQYWSAPSDKEGYSGVGLLSRQCPLKVSYGIGEEEHDQEGRVIVAEFESFVLVTAYVPNAGRGLVRLEYRQRWDEAFRKFLKDLASRKPLVLCGDLNVAHEEIDLRNPKGNKKNAGFTPQERQGFGELLQAVPLADSFRHLYPNTAYAYTFWTYMMNARSKNVGWRLDYFLLSHSLLPALCDSKIRSKALGSDHCPITLYLAL